VTRASSAPFRYHQLTKIPTNAVGGPGRSSHYSRLFAARQKETTSQSRGGKASAWAEWATRIQSVQSLQWRASAGLFPSHVLSRSAVSRCKRHTHIPGQAAGPSHTVVVTMSQKIRDLPVTSLAFRIISIWDEPPCCKSVGMGDCPVRDVQPPQG
jgi:hypothetical protein